MIRVGIECEQLEQHRFGIGHTLAQFLETATKVPNVEKKFRFVLYFKVRVPDDGFLNHPVFERKVLMKGRGFFNVSFNIFYHVLLPLRYWLDRIDVFLFPSNMLPAFFLGRAIVVLVNDVYWEAIHGTIPFRYRISYLLFCWWAAKRATIMTISEFSKRELQQMYRIPDERIFVNPWGIESIFCILPRDEEYGEKVRAIKHKLGVKKDFFLSVGQAFPRRHVKEAIEAFALIAKKYPDVQYLVDCMDKYNPPQLVELIHDVNKKLDRKALVYVEYLPRKDLSYLMNETLALVYVSSKEALGLPPLEALACGRPSILADTPISREGVGNDGFFVKNPDDPKEIAAYMEEILNNTGRVDAVIQAQSRELPRFNWREHTRKLLQLFYDIARKNKK